MVTIIIEIIMINQILFIIFTKLSHEVKRNLLALTLFRKKFRLNIYRLSAPF